MLREHNIISDNITFPSPLRQGEIIAAAALSTSERRRSRQFIQNGVFGNFSSNSELPAGCKWNAATECNIMLPLAAFPMHYYPAAPVE